MKPFLFALIAVTSASAAHAKEPEIPYPTGYRDWHHVKSMVIENGHPLFEAFGGIHHIYANKKALKGYGSSHFPDGAVIVFDLLDAPRADNALIEAERKVVGVMQKDAKKFAATGGWGFEGFAAGDQARRVVGDHAATACFACHAPQKDSDYVFSRVRE